MKNRFLFIFLLISIGFVSASKVKAEDDHTFEALKTTWDMQSDENKVGLLAPVIYVGVELTCEAAKWGWNKLFGDSEEDIEKKALNGLQCSSIYYYNNYNNTGKPAIRVGFTPSEDHTKFYVNLYGDQIDYERGYYELNKNHTGIICDLNKKLTSFPQKIKIEIIGPKSKETKVWTGTISGATN